MMREIYSRRYTIHKNIPIPKGFADDRQATWLCEQAQAYGLTFLLAHADDGVIWGRIEDGDLVTSHDAFPDISPPLRSITLQQARIFGENAELLVWRDGDGIWHARILDDRGANVKGEYFDEPQVQWGDHQDRQETRGFTLLADGQQGLRHAVPLPAGKIDFGHSGWRPVRLKVRHYLACDDDGLPFVAQSRLMGFSIVE